MCSFTPLLLASFVTVLYLFGTHLFIVCGGAKLFVFRCAAESRKKTYAISCKQIFYHFSLFLWWWCKMSYTHFQSDKKTGWEMVPLNTFLIFHFWKTENGKPKTVPNQSNQNSPALFVCLSILFTCLFFFFPFLSNKSSLILFISNRVLKEQNLTGVLPPKLAELTFLQDM